MRLLVAGGAGCIGSAAAELLRYWQHNLGATLALLEAMRAAGTRRVVFSSTGRIGADLGWQPELGLRAMVADVWSFVREGSTVTGQAGAQ